MEGGHRLTSTVIYHRAKMAHYYFRNIAMIRLGRTEKVIPMWEFSIWKNEFQIGKESKMKH